jgi:hypothetical protein
MEMGTLGRRVDRLLKAVEAGKVRFKKGNPILEEFVTDLAKVKRLPDGDIDLESCTPRVRSLSRSINLAQHTIGDIENPPIPEVPETLTPKEVEETQREYFRLLGEFFFAATGTSAEQFAEKTSFNHRIRPCNFFCVVMVRNGNCCQFPSNIGMRPSNTIAKWFRAAFQFLIGIVHFLDASWIAR